MRKPLYCGLFFVTLGHSAWGTPPDTIGMSARSIGSGGGGVAWVGDPTAAYLNPAGLGQLDKPEAQVGFMLGVEMTTAFETESDVEI